MDRIPVWIIDDASGATEGTPSDWEKSEDAYGGVWKRIGLMAFGRANALYRNRHYRCPDCESFLRPLRRRGFFACVGCLTAFKWRDGELSGYCRDSEAVIRVEPSEFNFR
jgi:hypothetical protein